MSTTVAMAGRRFGRLVVDPNAEPVRIGRRPRLHWKVRCDCGTEKTVSGENLRANKTMSCGKGQCFSRYSTGLANTSEYHCWEQIKQRTTNPNHKQYMDYGGRGITVCTRWLSSFENFYADMGPRPPGLTIERRNNDVGYFPENCYWAPYAVQANNKRPKHDRASYARGWVTRRLENEIQKG